MNNSRGWLNRALKQGTLFQCSAFRSVMKTQNNQSSLQIPIPVHNLFTGIKSRRMTTTRGVPGSLCIRLSFVGAIVGSWFYDCWIPRHQNGWIIPLCAWEIHHKDRWMAKKFSEAHSPLMFLLQLVSEPSLTTCDAFRSFENEWWWLMSARSGQLSCRCTEGTFSQPPNCIIRSQASIGVRRHNKQNQFGFTVIIWFRLHAPEIGPSDARPARKALAIGSSSQGSSRGWS